MNQNVTPALPIYRISPGNHTIESRVDKFRGISIMDLTPAQARGYVWIFHPPQEYGDYFIGVDPTNGIPGWCPDLASKSDESTDNSAISVWCRGRDLTYQVAEFAGPVDPRQCARITNALGRLYKGRSKQNMARLILEAYPGPGPLVENILLSQLAYYNYYSERDLSTIDLGAANGIGWHATNQSNQIISIHARNLINNVVSESPDREVYIRSPWLLYEMNDAGINPQNWSISVEGDPEAHDDRIRAAMLAWWLMHVREAVGMGESKPKTRVDRHIPSKEIVRDWQNSAVSADDMKRDWNRKFWELGND